MIVVGAVAYHPRVVTVWERFREWFGEQGLPIDYVLFSNYERLVEALLGGDVDLGWNTNTAFVTIEQRLGTQAPILGMRDVDADFATVLVRRKDDVLAETGDLAGRTLALGSRDSGHAAILPMHFLQQQGLDVAGGACELLRFDTDVGKHGDTGNSELHVMQSVVDGHADAGAVGDAMLAAFRAEGVPATNELEIFWRSPTYCHCNFTALPGFDEVLGERWLQTLLTMSYDDAKIRPAMDLEGVRRWLPGDRRGYESLAAAMA